VQSPPLLSAPPEAVSLRDLLTLLEMAIPEGVSPEEWESQVLFPLLRMVAPRNNLAGVVSYGRLVHGFVPAEHHLLLLRTILHALYKREDTLILMPAGAAKTTWGNTIFLSWLIALFKDIRVGLFSQTDEFAQAFSGAIMNTYDSNDEHIGLFGDLHGKKWTQGAWLRKNSAVGRTKDFTVFAGGTGGQVASKRFDLLLLDDILGEDNTATQGQRDKARTWFDKSLYPRLVSNGVCIAFGTRWADGDLYQTLLDPKSVGGYGFKNIVIRALIEDDTAPSGFRSYWPAIWPVEKLLELRSRNSASFDCTYQNDVSGTLSGDVFQKVWYKYYGTKGGDPNEELPKDRRWIKRMGQDLASSVKERADWSARVTSAEDPEGNFYVMRTHREKIAVGHPDFIAAGYEETPGIALVLVEDNQFQSTVIQEVLRDFPQIPIIGRKTDTDKVSRATAIAEKYRAGKIYHHESLRDGDLEREQLAFKRTGAAHDDLIDAEGFSMDLGGSAFIFGSFKRRW
jgi:predicted phage terminase large subunit-like protein